MIYSSVVTIEENGAPTAGTPSLSGLTNGWVGPAGGSAALAGSDQLGLRRIELVDASNGDAVVGTATNTGCVDWSVLPCSEPAAGLNVGFGGSVSLAGLSEGAHQLKARAVDAANNASLGGAVTVNVDRTAPVASGLGSGGARSAATAAVAWELPSGGSPITQSRVRICTGKPSPTNCAWQTAPGDRKLTLDLGVDGTVTTLQVEATDQAGNTGLSPLVSYRRDTTAPGPPTLTLTPGTGARRTVLVAAAEEPASGYVLRLCSAADCVESQRQATGRIDLDLPSYGTWRAEVATADAAGNVGAFASSTVDYPKPADEQPGTDPGQPGTNPDPPASTPKQPVGLVIGKRVRYGTKSVRVSGMVKPGAATGVTISVKTRLKGRTRSVTRRTTTKPTRTGAWAATVKFPAALARGRKVSIVVSAAPAGTYLPATVSRRTRR